LGGELDLFLHFRTIGGRLQKGKKRHKQLCPTAKYEYFTKIVSL